MPVLKRNSTTGDFSRSFNTGPVTGIILASIVLLLIIITAQCVKARKRAAAQQAKLQPTRVWHRSSAEQSASANVPVATGARGGKRDAARGEEEQLPAYDSKPPAYTVEMPAQPVGTLELPGYTPVRR